MMTYAIIFVVSIVRKSNDFLVKIYQLYSCKSDIGNQI